MQAAATRRSCRHDFLSGFGNAPRKKGKPVGNMICLLLASLIAWVLLSSSTTNLTMDPRPRNGPNGYFLVARKDTCRFFLRGVSPGPTSDAGRPQKTRGRGRLEEGRLVGGCHPTEAAIWGTDTDILF